MTKRLEYKKESMKWHHRFLKMAALVSSWSKHPDFQVGAVAVGDFGQVLSTGYNGWPRGVCNEEFLREQPPKNMPSLTIHAETNLIYNASLSGLSLCGSTVYVYPMFPCVDCAKALIQVGVSQIYYQSVTNDESDKKWKQSWEWAERLFKESGITITKINV